MPFELFIELVVPLVEFFLSLLIEALAYLFFDLLVNFTSFVIRMTRDIIFARRLKAPEEKTVSSK